MTAPLSFSPPAANAPFANGAHPAPTALVGKPGVAVAQPRRYAALNCLEQVSLTVARLAGLGFRCTRAIIDLAGSKSPALRAEGALVGRKDPRPVVITIRLNNLPVHLDHRCPCVSEQLATGAFAGVGQSFSELRKAPANGCCR